jgi:hypothetical protein
LCTVCEGEVTEDAGRGLRLFVVAISYVLNRPRLRSADVGGVWAQIRQGAHGWTRAAVLHRGLLAQAVTTGARARPHLPSGTHALPLPSMLPARRTVTDDAVGCICGKCLS